MWVNESKAQDASKVLGVSLQGMQRSTIATAWRAAAAKHHPDTAEQYDAELWQRLTWAKATLLAYLEQQGSQGQSAAPVGNCRACGGSGRVSGKPTGFGPPLTMQCVMCQGTGNVKRQDRDE